MSEPPAKAIDKVANNIPNFQIETNDNEESKEELEEEISAVIHLEDLPGAAGDVAQPPESEPPARKKKATPLPLKKTIIVCIILFTESFTGNSLFPQIGFMIKDFNLTSNDKLLGFYAGALASSFYLAQFICSFFWGRMSDRFGRKPILLIGMPPSLRSLSSFRANMNNVAPFSSYS